MKDRTLLMIPGPVEFEPDVLQVLSHWPAVRSSRFRNARYGNGGCEPY